VETGATLARICGEAERVYDHQHHYDWIMEAAMEAEAVSGLLGCCAARLSGLLGCAAARLRGCAAARLRGCAAVRLLSCWAAARLQRCRATSRLAVVCIVWHSS
jgi:hypothetical protein